VTPLNDLEEANAQLFKLHATVEEQTQQIANLSEQLDYLKKQLFGRKREKVDPAQLRLFEESSALLERLLEGSVSEEVPAPKKAKRKGHGRPAFADDLPRQTIKLDLPESERCCPDCGETMQPFGESVTERGHIIPARLVVKRYERQKYACAKGHGVKVAPLPDGVVDKGKYEASVYAFVATSKYGDHLPLHRLQGILKRQGVHLSKQTMWELLARLDELVAQPVLKEMRRQLLEERVLQSDETTARVMREGDKESKSAFLWAWRNLRGSPVEKVLVDFRSDRSARGPEAFLGDWTGVLLTDGYDGVNPIAIRNDIKRAGCWSHARRKFVDSLKSGKKKAAAALVPIQRIFWIERAILKRAERDGLDLERMRALRADVRNRLSRRALTQFYDIALALDADPKVTAGSHLQKAVGYVLNQREPLTAMLRHPEIPIHNNDTERDLRHVVVGRKNYSFFGSPKGGEVAGRLYSLVMSCKLADVDPAAYLEDALSLISTVRASDIASLTPWGWKAMRDAADGLAA
jgi:transposase